MLPFIPIIAWALGGALVGSSVAAAVALIVDAINEANEAASRRDLDELDRQLAKLSRSADGDDERVLREHGHRMSPPVRARFEAQMRARRR